MKIPEGPLEMDAGCSDAAASVWALPGRALRSPAGLPEPPDWTADVTVGRFLGCWTCPVCPGDKAFAGLAAAFDAAFPDGSKFRFMLPAELVTGTAGVPAVLSVPGGTP